MQDNAHFSTGMFEVENMNTFNTTAEQGNSVGSPNWIPTAFNNKASFVTIEPKCKLEAFRSPNFKNKIGQYEGGFSNTNIVQLLKTRNNKVSSFKCTCEKERTCENFYMDGKSVPSGCPVPSCDVDYEVIDAWAKNNPHNVNSPYKFGFALSIKVSAEHWNRAGWSLMLRWNRVKNASFQIWNANFFNFYRHNNRMDVMIHSRPSNAYWDRFAVHEFIFIADRLPTNSLPEFYFFEGKQQLHRCFQRSNDRNVPGIEFEEAVKASESVKDASDVRQVFITKAGDIRVSK
jgi:hypothetical protein